MKDYSQITTSKVSIQFPAHAAVSRLFLIFCLLCSSPLSTLPHSFVRGVPCPRMLALSPACSSGGHMHSLRRRCWPWVFCSCVVFQAVGRRARKGEEASDQQEGG